MSDARSRVRKRAIRHLGKKRTIATLGPPLLELLSQVSDADVGASNQRGRYPQPTEWALVLTEALTELVSGGVGAKVARMNEAPFRFVYGLTGRSREIIEAVRDLVVGAAAPEGFESHIAQVLERLQRCAPDVAEAFDAVLAPLIRTFGKTRPAE